MQHSFGWTAGLAAVAIVLAGLALWRSGERADGVDLAPAQAVVPDGVLISSTTTSSSEPELVPAAATREVPQSEAEIQLSFAPVVQEVAPAVVNVYASQLVQQRAPFWFQFGNDTRVQQSLGSGVIVDPDGLIITNNHVIEGATEIRVALADGTELSAELVLADQRLDLAALRIPSGRTRYPTIPFHDSDRVAVGDLVLAIGDPFGVGQTVTSGIVSGLARTITTEDGSARDQVFIQTDAAINPGNSGGALVDIEGRLVGINAAIYSSSGGSDGIGFAVPANVVRVFADAALRGERVSYPWIGASFDAVTEADADRAGINGSRGAVVAEVSDGSPAELAGLESGDVVVAYDGAPIDSPSVLSYHLLVSGEDHSARYEVMRRGRRIDLTITAIEPPETVARDQRAIGGRSPFTGAVVVNLSPAVASELGFSTTEQGVAIIDVPPGSVAEQAGLEPGDVVRAVNGAGVASAADLARMSDGGGSIWQLQIERDGQTFSTTLTMRG